MSLQPSRVPDASPQASDYAALFDALKATLLERAALPSGAASPERDAAHKANQERMEEDLQWAAGISFDPGLGDDEFWEGASTKPFYSGKQAGLIRRKVDLAAPYLRDYRSLASSDWADGGPARLAYEADENAYHNKKDLPRILKGARNIVRRQNNLGGRSLIDIFVPQRDRDLSPESVKRIHKNLNGELAFGFVTILHVMTDLGFPVVKTDRVLTRVAIRLGLVTHRSLRGYDELLPRDMPSSRALALGADPDFSFALQAKLREISDATGLSMRTIDWLLVKMGMEPDKEAGILNTICGDIPQCQLCKAQPFCRLGSSKMKR